MVALTRAHGARTWGPECPALLKRLLAAKHGRLSAEPIDGYEHLASVP